MTTSIYRDIIDDKIAEWRANLAQLEALLANGDREVQQELGDQVDSIRHRIDQAIVQLLILDKQETTANTMATKNRIIEVFNSVDRDFPHYGESAPYML